MNPFFREKTAPDPTKASGYRSATLILKKLFFTELRNRLKKDDQLVSRTQSLVSRPVLESSAASERPDFGTAVGGKEGCSTFNTTTAALRENLCPVKEK